MDYAPSQQLQPHRHDIDEVFEVRILHLGCVSRLLLCVDGPRALLEPQTLAEKYRAKHASLSLSSPSGGGSALVSKWPSGDAAKRETYTIKAGDLFEVPKDMPHALFCDPTLGLQFHETVGEGTESFAKRATAFLLTEGFALRRPDTEDP